MNSLAAGGDLATIMQVERARSTRAELSEFGLPEGKRGAMRPELAVNTLVPSHRRVFRGGRW